MATILVFFGHLFVLFEVTPFRSNAFFGYIQYLGVVVFVIISGILLSKSLEDNMIRMPLKMFFVHRNSKQIIAYVLALAFTCLGDSVIYFLGKYNEYYHPGSFSVKNIIASITLFSDISPFYSFGSSHQLWYFCAWFWMSTAVILYSYFNKEGNTLALVGLIVVLLICLNQRHNKLYPAVALGFLGGWGTSIDFVI